MTPSKWLVSIFFGFVLISFNCHSQPNYSINFSYGIFSDPKFYRIKIDRDSDYAKITLNKTVKINYKRLRKDKQQKVLFDSLMHVKGNKELQTKLFERIIIVHSKYIRSKEEYIYLLQKENQHYFNLLDSVFKADSQYLLNEDRNKNRIVLDGTTTHMMIFSNNIKLKDLYFQSPDYESHPIIARFIHDTFNVYSQNKGRNFLEK